MKHIKELIINNFQSHKYSELHFGQDLNVIIGPSDSGKTSIIRALKWVLYNEPSGDFFIREGENEVSVTIKLSDNTVLKRYRTKSKNGYQLITSDGIESVFEGIGTSVPQEIIDKTGISKMLLDGDHSNAINLGEQLEGPFLLSEKTSTRANAIGRLVGVDILDEALREVLKDIRNLNTTKNLKEVSIEELNKSIKEYDFVDELKIKYKATKFLLNKLKEYDYNKTKLEDIKNRHDKFKIDLSEVKNILLKLENIDTIDEISTRIKSNLDNYSKYGNIKLKINTIITSKTENKLVLSKLHYIDDIDKSLPNLIEMNRSYKLINSFRIEIDHINKSKHILKKTIDSSKLLDIAENSINDGSNRINKYNKLLVLNKALSDKQIGLKKGSAYLEKLLPYLKEEKTIIICNEKLKLLKKLNENSLKLNKLKNLNSEVKISLNKTKNDLKQTLAEYSNILDKVGICPYCLSEIDDKAIKHVIDYHIGG
ncbi:MAG: AAA family ATPase [Gudongella sp.]|nr:AAA family ATPase [Gudongella sp.]